MSENVTSGAGSGIGGRLIERVTEGMTVVDASGEKLGKVEYVQMGDPQAVTTQGNENQPDLIGRVGTTILGDEREPDVPEPARSMLVRSGFIKVDGPGLLDTDRYVRSDLIASVSDDTVTLTANKAQLLKEE